jgi:hypothetical protein
MSQRVRPRSRAGEIDRVRARRSVQLYISSSSTQSSQLGTSVHTHVRNAFSSNPILYPCETFKYLFQAWIYLKQIHIISLIWRVKALSFHSQVLSERAQPDNSGWYAAKSLQQSCHRRGNIVRSNYTGRDSSQKFSQKSAQRKMCSSHSRAVIDWKNKIWLRVFRAQVTFIFKWVQQGYGTYWI